MLFRQISDPKLAQNAYLIGCQQTGEALVVDPERDVDRYLAAADAEGLEIVAVAETHIHADFLSGARELAERHGAHLYLSAEGGDDWQSEWARRGDYELTLLTDGDLFRVGKIELRAVHTPGHTPEHLSFVVTDHGGGADQPIGILSGDFVFVGDLGRPDLLESAAGVVGMQEPSARLLHASLDRFLDLPDFLQVWPAHGAGSACGKALGAVPMTTVGYERRFNGAIDAARRGVDAFVDAILAGQPEPPLYFAAMKRLNKEGPPPLGGLPRPERFSAADLAAESVREDTVVIDTRLDRTAFMVDHLRDALFAPLDRNFPTVTGSYLRSDDRIVLLTPPEHVDEAVRDLVRVGFDNIVGWAPPETLQHVPAEHRTSIPIIDFRDAETLAEREDTAVLDVRRADEHASGHFPEAIHIAHTRLLDRLDALPNTEQLIVYCASGNRAAAASSMLARTGRKVLYVDDSFHSWHNSRDAA